MTGAPGRPVLRFAWPLAVLASLGLVYGLAGSSAAPSLAAQFAQLLPPGVRVDEVRLVGGGFLRAETIDPFDGGLRLQSRSRVRTLRGVVADGPIRERRLWLGTDHLGRDVLARAAAGAKTSMTVAIAAALIGGWIGMFLGLTAGWSPSWLQAVLDWWTDGILGLPRLLLLLVLGMVLRGSAWGVGLAIGLTSWMGLSRLVRAEVRSLLGHGFMEAVHATGSSGWRAAVRHLLPNVTPLLWVALPLLATDAVLLEATLSFLGVPTGVGGDSWGAMIADGRRTLPGGWWISVIPGLLILATALAFQRLSALVSRSRDRSVSVANPRPVPVVGSGEPG